MVEALLVLEGLVFQTARRPDDGRTAVLLKGRRVVVRHIKLLLRLVVLASAFGLWRLHGFIAMTQRGAGDGRGGVVVGLDFVGVEGDVVFC